MQGLLFHCPIGLSSLQGSIRFSKTVLQVVRRRMRCHTVFSLQGHWKIKQYSGFVKNEIYGFCISHFVF